MVLTPIDTRRNVSKKRTTWPGQHLRCGVCGRPFFWTGTAARKMMMCSGAHVYRCWSSVLINGEMVSTRLSQAILREIRALPDFDERFVQEVKQRLGQAESQQRVLRTELVKKQQAKQRQIDNVTAAVANGLGSRSLLEKLDRLESECDDLREELDQINEIAKATPELPSMGKIHQAAERVLGSFQPDSPEAGRLMRKLVPDLRVFPFRLCDGGAVVLRAKVTLTLTALMPDHPEVTGDEGLFQRELWVNLFDMPQRARFREQVVQMRGEGMTEKQVAHQLNITKTAAQQAATLDRLMKHQGIEDPWLAVTAPPEDYGKLRRHKHPRYRFEPSTPQ